MADLPRITASRCVRSAVENDQKSWTTKKKNFKAASSSGAPGVHLYPKCLHLCLPLPLRTPLLDNSWEALCLNACTLDVMLVNTNSFVIPGMNFVGKAISKIVHCCLQALQYEPGLKEKGPTTGQNL
ncbi:uncharacterized protein LOC125758130 isoform X1 [Rhipicephalus sanguineus]|uniref:uncharacterized protein LOC125758130 isoform X1 n=1 Tax=Rhipicephalus sanguineus TaxID=34632 RepID=UPI0020C1E6B1|nr:uncharacterized protein LOC125758130 isoform X1 [Rhipicephalus sanguineus]